MMNVRRFTMSVASRTILAVVLPVTVAMATVELNREDLAKNSPFLPEGYTPPQERRPPPPPPPRPPPPAGPQAIDQLEFRGMTTIGGRTSFSIFDPAQNRSFWIEAGQSDGGFEVVEFKDREDSVVVKHAGNTRTIPLRQAKVAVLTPEAAPPPATRAGDSGTREAASAQPQDPDERMRNLAEEIRRRREVRRAIVEEAEASLPPQAQSGVARPAGPVR